MKISDHFDLILESIKNSMERFGQSIGLAYKETINLSLSLITQWINLKSLRLRRQRPLATCPYPSWHALQALETQWNNFHPEKQCMYSWHFVFPVFYALKSYPAVKTWISLSPCDLCRFPKLEVNSMFFEVPRDFRLSLLLPSTHSVIQNMFPIIRTLWNTW